ncbi:hypothetical protein J7I84_08795 [Arthrobacter sp. ISL-85]|uniref:hypothetical protein n=1 Tax=Arthrobacter sp. ISL-85 TaxID=2819115 RepID=UPI001BEA9832|nr:hypothetical protein [Arthrobacter sp. ISL-85]MBT2566589.1 hypothetical protein [Arthrobacter sp. ISL-85]
MTQFLTAILRTVVPSLWGGFIAWLILLVPQLLPLQAYLLGLSEPVTAVVTAVFTSVVIAAWYALWRWLQPRIPVWLVQAVLGSAKTPVYSLTPAAGAIDDGPKHSAAAPVVNNITIHAAEDPQATAEQVANRLNQLSP